MRRRRRHLVAALVLFISAACADRMLSRAPKAEALDAEWKKVAAVYAELLKPAR